MADTEKAAPMSTKNTEYIEDSVKKKPIQWTHIVRPLLGEDSSQSLQSFCLDIINCESELLGKQSKFKDAFVVLCADYLARHTSQLSGGGAVETISGACRVLLHYILHSLQNGTDQSIEQQQIDHYIKSVQALCCSDHSNKYLLSETEVAAFTTTLKEDLPVQNTGSVDNDALPKVEREKEKNRSDLSYSILEQLTKPLWEGGGVTKLQKQQWEVQSEQSNQDFSAVESSEPAGEINKIFLKANIESLQALKAGDTFLDLCLNLPQIKKAKQRVCDSLGGKSLMLPTTQAEANVIRNSLSATLSEVEVAVASLSLPILEPLTPARLEKVSTISTAVLYCAVSHSTAVSVVNSVIGITNAPKSTSQVSKDEDPDSNAAAVSLVEAALNLYTQLGLSIKTSSHAGGLAHQNYVLAGAWLLVTGLQTHVSSATLQSQQDIGTIGKGRSPSKLRECSNPSSGTGSAGRSALSRFQQSFGVLNVALATRALQLLSVLFEDLDLEVCSDGGATTGTFQVEPAAITVTGEFTAEQRVARILGAIPLNQLFFYIALVSYRKASSLKRLRPLEGDAAFIQSNTATSFYEDMILCSDVSSTDEDDDSEPILGQWFEETLAPPDDDDNKTNATYEMLSDGESMNGNKAETCRRGDSGLMVVVPEKGEAHGFIALATAIFVFLNRHILTSKSTLIGAYVKAGLTEQQIVILAAIVRDLDRESARTDTGTISAFFGQSLNVLYSEFSGALSRFTHNLVTHPNLQQLQVSFLTHLSVSPWNPDFPHGWPLQVYPRTLSVLAQILLLRPQNEKEASVINIWHRLVNTLIENVLGTQQQVSDAAENDDLNVEHAQVLVYLFHSLNLMQKKSVVLMMAGGLLRCSDVVQGHLKESQLLHLSRLLLLFDYIMKHLYDAPQQLLEQIQYNLFHSTNLNGTFMKESPKKESKQSNNSDATSSPAQQTRMYTPCLELEERYDRKVGSTIASVTDEVVIRPRFYLLSNISEQQQDTLPKLDGLAVSFVLGTPDKLRYPLLQDALIEILNVTHMVDDGKASESLSLLGLCCVQYCFSISWRLLQMLPPSTSYIERLSSGESLPPGKQLQLHTLFWSPRCNHKIYSRWIKDCLIKQGMQDQQAEKSLKTITDSVNKLKYDVENTKATILALTPDVKKGILSKRDLPPLWHLYVLHALIAKMQLALIKGDDSESSNVSTEEDTSSGDVGGGLLNFLLTQELKPHVLRLTQAIFECVRWSVLNSAMEDESDKSSTTATTQNSTSLHQLMSIASSVFAVGWTIDQRLLLPQNVLNFVQKWNFASFKDCNWTPFINDVIPSEAHILDVIEAHISTLSIRHPFDINSSLKQLLACLVNFYCHMVTSTAKKIHTTDEEVDLLVSLTLDVRTEFLRENVVKTVEKLLGDAEIDEQHQKRLFLHILERTYDLIKSYTAKQIQIDERILHSFLDFYEKMLEKPAGRQAMEMFLKAHEDLVQVLMSVVESRDNELSPVTHHYSTQVLRFFNSLFKETENMASSEHISLCNSLRSGLASVDGSRLRMWLEHVIVGSNNEATPPPTNATSKSDTAVNANEETTTVTTETKSTVQENSQLLQSLTNFIVKQSTEPDDVAISILKALLPLGGRMLSFAQLNGPGFCDLMSVLVALAEASVGRGHIYLVPAVAEWLEVHGKTWLCNSGHRDVLDQIANQEEIVPGSTENGTRTVEKKTNPLVMVDATCCMLNYIGDVVNGIVVQSQMPMQRPLSPPWESEASQDPNADYEYYLSGGTLIDPADEVSGVGTGGDEEEIDDEEAAALSDEDSALCNKLCTFTVTQKEFMNQHWYHCHTCRMLDGVGVCSVCARVCHRGHDVTYAKYGNFFCDCGAKEDGSCQALVKRSPTTEASNTGSAIAGTTTLAFSEDNLTKQKELIVTTPIVAKANTEVFIKRERRRNTVVKELDASKEFLLNYLGGSTVPSTLLEVLRSLLPAIQASTARSSPVGSFARAMKALQGLHSQVKKYSITDSLMVPTLGSQEGAFENVRMSYAGEQGQTIRQLLSAHIIHRVTMCCMSSAQTNGKRQHLAVAHEKGKITLLQLSALLKQADSSTRKLTLTRLASAPIPFTVLSLSSNQCNEDYLAVCGLKDCHVLTFTSLGSVTDHLVLHPQLETGNFIIKAVWLPGSQTKLALVTADFVKIYDLSVDALSPQYYFLVPSGKIRDCTFICGESGVYSILIMSSPGQIYTELLNEESSAKHGTFYVTNTLEVFHLDLTDVNGQVAGGGVSIYYSHTLRLLFFSYAQGKSFVSPITSPPTTNNNCLTVVFPINLPTNSSTASGNSGGGATGSTKTGSGNSNSGGSGKTFSPQPLCQWTEIPNHPGLICCAMQSSNNPVVIMLKPESLAVQEIRVVPSKSKIMDMVAIRHNSGAEQRTTLILLCEDGSLKIYMANMDQTGFWMSPNIQPSAPTPTYAAKPKRKKITGTVGSVSKSGGQSGGKALSSITFPVDFFESCTVMNDVEIGGTDLLQIYNVGQLKHRLNTNGLYVVCTKAMGFAMEITNNDSNMIMTGIRVLMGTQDPGRAPTFVEVFTRIITTTTTRARWFDIPFSREESLQADKKLTVTFGPSVDPEAITILDSIKVYGKTKESFGWPEETDDVVTPNPVPVATSATPGGTSGAAGNPDAAVISDKAARTVELTSVTKIQRIASGSLDILDGTFSLYNCQSEDKMTKHRASAISVASELLTIPTSPALQMHSTSLLSSLYPSTSAYHIYKDQTLLQHVVATLTTMTEVDLSINKDDLDAESYYRLVLIVRSIAVNRPQNLVKFADAHIPVHNISLEEPLEMKSPPTLKPEKSQHILLQLMDVLWLLHSLNPSNPAVAPVVVAGLKHTEQVIFALVEILHAFSMCDDSYNKVTLAAYLQLLLCTDPLIAFSAKHALSRVLKPKSLKRNRRVFIPSPPLEKSGIESEDDKLSGAVISRRSDPSTSSGQAPEANANLQQQPEDLGSGEGVAGEPVNPLEAFLGGNVAAAFQPLLDIPLDADDETMVELAIALSLQDHQLVEGGGQAQQDLQVNPVLGQPGAGGSHIQEAGHYSDTTASAAGSDDEGSTAATDGSTLRTSPAEQGGSGGSESGGSGVESITGEHNVSGRSSAYGDNVQENLLAGSSKPEASASQASNYQAGESDRALNSEGDTEQENNGRLHALRIQLLERLIEYLPNLRNVPGVRVIPFFQVILQLTSELDGRSDRDKSCLNQLLSTLIGELQLDKPNLENVCTRTNQREVQLIIMRLLSVLMTKWKGTSANSAATADTTAGTSSPTTSKYSAVLAHGSGNSSANVDNNSIIATATATALHKADCIGYCLKLLQALLDYWKGVSNQEEVSNASSVVGGNLLKSHQHQTPPDMSPFFLRQFVKGHASDIFQMYPQLVSEMALRLPYQVHKYSEITEPIGVDFETAWFKYLCEYMMFLHVPFIRRLVRKLLLFICGSKGKYRQLRDIHNFNAHMKAVRVCCVKGGFNTGQHMQYSILLPYDTLVEMVEHLKACLEIASSRVGNWQKFCIRHNDMLPFLFQASCILDEGVAPTILQLLNCAIVHQTSTSKKTPTAESTSKSSTTTATSRKDREKSDDSVTASGVEGTTAAFEESSCASLVEQINQHVSKESLARFVRTFILESNQTTLRWQAHSLFVALYKNSKLPQKESLLELLWQLWPLLPAYGRKAAQFVDLLGFFSLRMSQTPETRVDVSLFVDRAVEVLRCQNDLLAHHPNTNIYTHMSQYVDLEGYYLESDPCLVCNTPEVPLSTIKLTAIKVDSKFTTTTQIVKLLSSHTIGRITIRIGDLKRTKMVRTVNIYYNNRTVQAVVELKNKPALWHKAKKVNLTSGQTEVKIEFLLPIVACNLMIEYADFYENVQASSETLQCPRCSANVPANPGVCSNCGENVFQCHKCRAINYDEKDPFLCHACGFCKYAKFDFTLQAKPCCAVEPIESDDDRKKMVSSINGLLEKADRVYKQLMATKPSLEQLVLKVSEQSSLDRRHILDEQHPQATSNAITSGGGGSAAGGAGSTFVTASSMLSGAIPAATAAAVAANQIKINKTIQLIAQQYCNECKTSFEDLSKIIQKVLVSRKELIAYDRRHRDLQPTPVSTTNQVFSFPTKCTTRCYGCSTAATEHCLTLLRALAINTTLRKVLCSKGLIQELLANNLRKGSIQIQEEVRHLLCILSKDNAAATEELCELITKRVCGNGFGDMHGRHEIALLAALQRIEDDSWETRLRCLVNIFLKATAHAKSPTVVETVILPCLQIWHGICKPPSVADASLTVTVTNKKSKDKINNVVNTKKVVPSSKNYSTVQVDVRSWVQNEPAMSYAVWSSKHRQKHDAQAAVALPTNKSEIRNYFLSEKYANRWLRKTITVWPKVPESKLKDVSWVKTVLFNPSSRLARNITCNILSHACSSFIRKKQILGMLTNYLQELTMASESASEYLALYQSLIQEIPWKQYLTVKLGVLTTIAQLMTHEIDQLHRLEENILSSTTDLTQGYALNQLAELLALFMSEPIIRRQYKGRLVGAVLNGYLSLRRLVVQRTRLIDETQEKLLFLLEEMTTGTEEETKAFMHVCMETVERYNLQDFLTPVFIFERLCSIIYPEENDIGEFFLTLEKDPQQEDFLQGRMLGNPYSSAESGLGPLMRDVKNKICGDCELVALLEDDNGMELLVHNKIMSLDLPVREVYKKVWLAEGGEVDSMRVVYRMRGLLGDATEEFVETLNNKTQAAVDNEEVYKMANVLVECGGLKVMVERLGAIQNVQRAKPLLQVLLKLFRLSVKVVRVQEVLIDPELGAMEVFLRTLQMCLEGEADTTQAAVTEQLLDIMETIMAKATSQSLGTFMRFSRTFGGPEYIQSLLTCSQLTSSTSPVRANQAVLVHLTRVLAALVYVNPERMATLIDHFKSALDFNKYDMLSNNLEEQQKLEMFCVLTDGIERNAIGATLKDYIIDLGVLRDALFYIKMHAPCVKPTLLRTDSDELKEFISKPALKYILRFLAGICKSHEQAQMAVSKADTIPIIHRLEQVSSDEHVGSLAENLLEALRTNPYVATKIEEVRDFTRSEKKRLAMAMREKQLGQLGMRTNDKGQVTAAKSKLLQQQMEELDMAEETGLVCCICREGYKYQPTKVLAIYTFTKRCNVEEVECKGRCKTVGYSTVTHFNVVHVDCHMSAVRLARARDEWESAALQNANTKCNGLLPLWGPKVPESAFASCLARHNTYLQESTNHRDNGHVSTVHDLKLLLLRFAQEKTFHEDTGGGGPQSNMHMIPYLIHMALYVINTTRSSKKEEQNLNSYLEQTNPEKLIESCYEAEGGLYWLTMAVLLQSRTKWLATRVAHLRRMILLGHMRSITPPDDTKTISDRTPKDYGVYKPYLVFFGLVDGMYAYFFKNVSTALDSGGDEDWSTQVADFIRHNDEALLKGSEKLLATYTDELLPCVSFEEFCDVLDLLDIIANPSCYIAEVLNGV